MTTPITSLPGVGEKRAALFAALGLHTVEDLLLHFPRGYQHRGNVKLLSEAEDGETASFLLTVASEPQTAQLKNRMTLTKFSVIDDSRKATVVYFNQNYIARSFHVGQTFRFWGKLKITAGQYELASPDYEPYREDKPLPEFYPIYPLTAGLTQKIMQATVRAALSHALREGIADRLPDGLREKYRLCTLEYALKAIHEPLCYAMLEQGRAYFVFEELFLFSLGIGLSKRRIQKEKAPVLSKTDETGEALPARFYRHLPYTPTNAQKRVIGELWEDMTSPDGLPMSRIVVGDVGSGKTVCAAAAAFIAGRSGYQSALMVPTSILARQHYDDLTPLFEELGLHTALLIG